MTNIAIVGGGLVGTVTALLLAKQKIACTLIEPQDFTKNHSDPRTVAVHYGSRLMFESLGIWEKFSKNTAPIKTIRVFERGHAEAIHYHAKDIHIDAMGYIVEHSLLLNTLRKEVKKNNYITLIQDVFERVTQLANKVELTTHKDTFFFDMLIGCDGRKSHLRQQLNFEILTKKIGQTALVAHLHHEKPHQNQAWEVFTKNGPFALLPFHDDHTSGLVWCKPEPHNWHTENDEELYIQMKDIFPFYGEFTFKSARFTYPLVCQTIKKLAHGHVLLIGDSAHTLHPIAGQGVNLGWEDARFFVSFLHKNMRLGQSIPTILADFSVERMREIKMMRQFTNGVNDIFLNTNPIIKGLRRFGFNLVESTPIIKKALMKRAMGI